jgi:uncharacterized metal-binding protein YceD (DUF177 family)
MKHSREFEIAWQGLKPGPHICVYDLDDHFMMEHGAVEGFKNWAVKVTMTFDKHEDFFMIKFDVGGKVTVACDRCGDDYDLSLWDEFNLLIKLISDAEPNIDEEDDVIFIHRHETVIDVSEWLYEYVMLSLPIRRVHPDNPDGSSGCNPVALKLLDQLSGSGDDTKKGIWKDLDKLKN